MTSVVAIASLGDLDALKGSLIAVNFWADWCPPCPQMNSVFAKLAELHGKELKFVSVRLRVVCDCRVVCV